MSIPSAHSLQPGLIGREDHVSYAELLPPAELAHYIDRLYVLETTDIAQFYPVVADACADLLFDCTGFHAPLLSLSLSRPLPSTLPAGVCLVGARLKPGGIGRLLQTAAAPLDGSLNPLHALPMMRNWQPRDLRGDPQRLLERLCEQLEGLPGSDGEQQLVEAALLRLDTEVESLTAKELDISERHLRRLLARRAGLPPKRYQRVRRFQQGLSALAAQPDIALATLAAEVGYSDQAHLGHDWLDLSGYTPGYWRGRFLQEGQPASG